MEENVVLGTDGLISRKGFLRWDGGVVWGYQVWGVNGGWGAA